MPAPGDQGCFPQALHAPESRTYRLIRDSTNPRAAPVGMTWFGQRLPSKKSSCRALREV